MNGTHPLTNGSDEFIRQFSDWWRSNWLKSSVKYPEEGLVFDYLYEPETGR